MTYRIFLVILRVIAKILRNINNMNDQRRMEQELAREYEEQNQQQH